MALCRGCSVSVRRLRSQLLPNHPPLNLNTGSDQLRTQPTVNPWETDALRSPGLCRPSSPCSLKFWTQGRSCSSISISFPTSISYLIWILRVQVVGNIPQFTCTLWIHPRAIYFEPQTPSEALGQLSELCSLASQFWVNSCGPNWSLTLFPLCPSYLNSPSCPEPMWKFFFQSPLFPPHHCLSSAAEAPQFPYRPYLVEWPSINHFSSVTP